MKRTPNRTATRRQTGPIAGAFLTVRGAAAALTVGQSPAELLASIEQVHRAADAAASALIREMRSVGLSWADIGAELGVSKQAAQQRWARATE